MPLPFILAGAAIVAAGYGVKKGVDAKDDLDEVKSLNNKTKRIADEATSKLEKQKKSTNDELEKYGKMKSDAAVTLLKFQDFFDVRNSESINNSFPEERRIILTEEEEVGILKDIGVIENDLTVKSAIDKVKAHNASIHVTAEGFKSLSTGSLAGAAAGGGAYLGVGSLATASTGTAISGLSGAAATNATLAWLGGGSLASGGFGMAGGTLVLGGLVAGPLLAIGGAVFAYKAAEAKDAAKQQYSKISSEVKKVKIIISQLSAIETHTTQCAATFSSLLKKLATNLIPKLEDLAQERACFSSMNGTQRETVAISYQLAFMLKDLINVGVMNETGSDVNPESQKHLDNANKSLKEI